MTCKICNKEVKSITALGIHLSKKHKLDKTQKIEYYDNYLKKVDEGVCYFCGERAKFHNLSKGYHRICTSKVCLGKTRATGTYEFLMYKYNLSKDEALIEQQKRANKRGEKIKEKFDELYKCDENYHKKRSHQTKEYWLNKGFSEKESIEKASIVMGMIHEKTWDKRRSHPELYDNVNTTQLKYWLDKGYSEEDAIEKRKERQITFSLEICIEKYGVIEGRQRWLDRQEKWHNNYKKSNFSKISQELFWCIYDKLNTIEKANVIFATIKDGKLDDSGSNNELRLRLDNVVLPDFIDLKTNRIIEFNGTYYHTLRTGRIEKDKIRNNMIKSYGYEIFNVDERDYKDNKELIIEKCVKYLRK